MPLGPRATRFIRVDIREKLWKFITKPVILMIVSGNLLYLDLDLTCDQNVTHFLITYIFEQLSLMLNIFSIFFNSKILFEFL